jgi:uncharacterized membrane protein YgcG
MPPRKKKETGVDAAGAHPKTALERRLDLLQRVHLQTTPTLLKLPFHGSLLNRLRTSESLSTSPNLLFYGSRGFPLEYMAYGLFPEFAQWTKQPCLWQEKLPYFDYQGQLLEIQCRHPEFTKNLDLLCDFMKHILTTRCMYQSKYLFLIRDIDVLAQSSIHYAFRVLLERYSNNVLFMATTHTLSKIEPPLQSRFMLLRIPFPSKADLTALHLESPTGHLLEALAIHEDNICSSVAGVTGVACAAAAPMISKQSMTPAEVRINAYQAFQKGQPFAEFCMALIQESKKPHWLVRELATLEAFRAKSCNGGSAGSAGSLIGGGGDGGSGSSGAGGAGGTNGRGRDPIYFEKALWLSVFANTLSK